MSRNGSGVYSLPAGNPVVTGTTIASSWANNTMSDLAAALTGSVAADGQTPMTGALDMNTHKITGVTSGTASGEAVEFTQFDTPTFNGDVTCLSTGYIKIPVGTTAERDVSPVNGQIRYNTTTSQFEGYANGWGNIGGGATGGGGDTVFNLNSMVVTTTYAIPSGKSASSVGPIVIDSGVDVTIPNGSRWIIL